MIYIGDIIHASGPDPLHPIWDTMLVLRNLSSQKVTARIKVYREADGSLVRWPGSTPDIAIVSVEVALDPGSCWPVSFIPGNGFENPPQDFAGHATIECLSPGPFAPINQDDSIIAYALIANRWSWGQSVPCVKDGTPMSFGARKAWQFAYAIPHFDDRQGATARLWVTGISVQNLENKAVPLKLRYVVGQTYAEKGQEYSIEFSVPANGGVRFDMLTGNADQDVPGLLSAGYPQDLNSEGFVDLTTANESVARLIPHFFIASNDYSFMAEEEPAS
jgi:hypothetical protein